MVFDQGLLINSLLSSTIDCPKTLAFNISRGAIPSNISLPKNEMKLWMLESGLLTEENLNLGTAISWDNGPWMPCRKLTKNDLHPNGAKEICMTNKKPETAKYLNGNWIFTNGDASPRRFFMAPRLINNSLAPGTETSISRSTLTKCIRFDPVKKKVLIKSSKLVFLKIIDTYNYDKYIGHNITWRSKPIFKAIKLIDKDSF